SSSRGRSRLPSGRSSRSGGPTNFASDSGTAAVGDSIGYWRRRSDVGTFPHMTNLTRRALALAALSAVPAAPALAQSSQTAAALPSVIRARIDSIATLEMKARGAPSISLAIVKDGAIAYTNAYGLARLEPPTRAVPSMRYSIGSVSKQFTATAILML